MNAAEDAPKAPKLFACMSCRTRKLKCDNVRPKCGTCAKGTSECEYVAPSRRRVNKRRNIQVLEERLQMLEGKLKGLNKTKPRAEASEVQLNDAGDEDNASDEQPAATTINMPASARERSVYCHGPDPSIPRHGWGQETAHPRITASHEILESLKQADAMDWRKAPLGLKNFVLEFSHLSDELHENGESPGDQRTPDLTSASTSPSSDTPLPDIMCQTELFELYFDAVHPSVPILHKDRFMTAVRSRTINQQPALFLQYAVWALASTLSPKYKSQGMSFYNRGRELIQIEEAGDTPYTPDKGRSTLMGLDHIRYWAIITEFETRMMMGNRGWTSIGRALRLCQLVGLDSLDDHESPHKHAELRDWTDVEGARRMFWYIFTFDRYSAVITGRPLTIDEEDICTNLPATEYAYQNSQPEATEAYVTGKTLSGITAVSPFGVTMITAGLFGELARHMRKREPSMAQIDVVNGAFWKRHWDLDARIVKLQILAPHMIKTSMGQHYDEGQVHAANLLIQALVIGLYKAAAAKVNQWQLDENIGAQCTARSSAAAEEIVRCLKRATPASINRWQTFAGFCMHMAIGSLSQGISDPLKERQSRMGLETLLTIFRSLRPMDTFLWTLVETCERALKRPMIETSVSGSDSVSYMSDSPLRGEHRQACNKTNRGGLMNTMIPLDFRSAPTPMYTKFSTSASTSTLSSTPTFAYNKVAEMVSLDPFPVYDFDMSALDGVDFQLQNNVDANFGAAVLEEMENFQPMDLHMFNHT